MPSKRGSAVEIDGGLRVGLRLAVVGGQQEQDLLAAAGHVLSGRYVSIVIRKTWISALGLRGIRAVLVADGVDLLVVEDKIGRRRGFRQRLGQVDQRFGQGLVTDGPGPEKITSESGRGVLAVLEDGARSTPCFLSCW